VKFIRRILDRRKVWDTLPDYPVYSPPFSYGLGWKTIPSRDQIEQNYEYFLRRKADRLEHLAAYLAPFSVELRIEPDALSALGRWLYRYGGHLVPDGGNVISALDRYEPAWIGEYRGPQYCERRRDLCWRLYRFQKQGCPLGYMVRRRHETFQ
jgi:hypothetical protein